LDAFARDLPQATKNIFTDRGHFKQPHFPELVVVIKNLFN
jgi:hypothetical protein